MHKHKKYIFAFFCVFFFGLGFIVHALFFPSFLFESIRPTQAEQSKNSSSVPFEDNKSLTTVSYENGVFVPSVVKIRKSYYLRIVNASKNELMWLTSENPMFRTSRGYGESEELRTILYDPGIYTISTTLHPEKKLQVIVQ